MKMACNFILKSVLQSCAFKLPFLAASSGICARVCVCMCAFVALCSALHHKPTLNLSSVPVPRAR